MNTGCAANSRTGKFLTASCFLSPVLSMYGFIITTINLGDIILIVSIILALIDSVRKRSITISTAFLPYFIYIVLHLLITLFVR